MMIDPARYWLGNVVPVSASEAARLYWETDIPAAEIIETYSPGDHPNKITVLAGKAYSPFVCEDCDGPILVSSRSNAQDLFRGQRKGGRCRGRHSVKLQCDTCWQAWRDRISAPYVEQMRRMEERKRELRTMPYQEYLTTQEWADKRSAALRRAGYRCQACASDGKLHVHHRTYIRRGMEHAADLIALCSECHRLFHERRSLANAGRAAS